MLTVGGVLIGLIAGAVGLLFEVAPGLQPCLGGSDAAFTGAPVFPRVNYRDYLANMGKPTAHAPPLVGVVVSFSFHTNGLRGHELPIIYSLLTIERDGTLGPVVREFDAAPDMTIAPKDCSQTVGSDLFIPITRPGKRYQVVLELYRDKKMTDRLALTQTAIFRG